MTDQRRGQDGQRAAPSKIERIKTASEGLRGSIAETIASEATHFAEEDVQALKFHGVYQQDDRDARTQRRRAGLDKAWMLMIRLTIPGGVLTPRQWLTLDGVADAHADSSLRLTTRQSVQFHGVLKGDLKPLLKGVNEALITTLAACGDVERNVMASPAPMADDLHQDVQRVAREIARDLAPATGAYYEIWLDGERISRRSAHEEYFYGETYLPRKFKTGVAIDTDNSVDIYAYDCGLVAITRNGRVEGYNLLVGGGFGMTHRKPDTFARLATPIGFVAPAHAVDTAREVAAIFRDHGNRSDRRHARLKYLVEEWGVERFRDELARRLPFPLHEPASAAPAIQKDYLGVHEQGDGQFFVGVFVQNGRVIDHGEERVKTAFRDVVQRLRPGVRLTPMQSILFTDLTRGQVDELFEILATHGVRAHDDLSSVVRYSMACPALPTCGLALAESERLLPDVLPRLEAELARLGLEDVPLNVRMTGCPNGCARPYNADIGFVGRKPGVYHVFVGGGLRGDRLADLYAADVGVDDFVPTLRPLLERFAAERSEGEGLGDFYQRLIGHREPRMLITGDETPTRDLVSVSVGAS